MKRFLYVLGFVLLTALGCSGCDVIYGVLHKPGGEERKILCEVVFNEYNPRVEELQKILRALGFSVRPDGKFGASSREAVARFQADEGLEVTRFVDKATWERMQGYLGSPLFRGLDIDVFALQRALQKAGVFSGRVDGLIGPQTRRAVREFQKAKGLSADGFVGLKTIKVLMTYQEKAGAEAGGEK